MYDYNNPYSTVKYPIRARSHETAGFTRTVEGYNCLKDINRGVLRRYVLLALDDRKMLSPRSITEDDLTAAKKESDKTYTHIVYGDDINHRHGGQVFFANKHDVDTLMSFLEAIIGPARMDMLKRNINGEPDDVEKVASEYYRKWKLSDEDWPLK